jgi:hypothetical protein
MGLILTQQHQGATDQDSSIIYATDPFDERLLWVVGRKNRVCLQFQQEGEISYGLCIIEHYSPNLDIEGLDEVTEKEGLAFVAAMEAATPLRVAEILKTVGLR